MSDTTPKPTTPAKRRKSDDELCADLLAKRAAIDARVQAIAARKREAERKRDTRRKILLGGYMLALLPDDDAKSLENWLLNEQRVAKHTQERDREEIIAAIKEAGARRPPAKKEPPAAQ